MSEADTRAAITDIIDAYVSGDSDRLAARYHDDIDWIFHAPVAVFPFAGARRGKAAVFQGLAMLDTIYKLESFNVVSVLVDGDHAATLAEVTMIQRATGRAISSRIGGFHRFRDGKLVEYRGFTDSFDSVEQVIGRWIEV